ncbi:hypothetical protein SUBVAR_05573 [Subdoligranulum variabile DSM 15176]|uniref:Uncharacterized protein n=1 Tax=Subdoligranulum variabile DSM 15176 TaxID=411471 RepID=D1PML2_9FIRM|nr:hypothetical protein SUBVAR_05573 [Subdoligranulum variabile DSM 15176]
MHEENNTTHENLQIFYVYKNQEIDLISCSTASLHDLFDLLCIITSILLNQITSPIMK